ncbi:MULTISPECIES: NnrS family protein [unclassified Microbulbifer]|uniref:NnrS family protein n=1 Tax=unclassified Microbulbifer TaxID=2619833 RepID=UPI0027E3CFA8|nr:MULTISPECIES: NnrS family protein [unclassified Microbulbifer]
MQNARPAALLAYGFRPFFLLTGLYAVVVILGWMGFLFGGWSLPLGWSPFKWHSHEMLYGMVPAAIAGFLLTAITNWTEASPIKGWRLLLLVLLWLAGRVLMWLASWTPAWLVALVDLAFLPALALYLLRVLLQHNNRRNLILVAVLTLLFIGNLLMHLGFASGRTGLLDTGEQLGFDLIVLLMAVIAGRIIPAFTANWLRFQGGNPDWVTRSAWTDRVALISLALLTLMAPLDALGAPAMLIGLTVLAAALSNGLRLWQWAGWRARKEPLLWILHLAYAWIVLGLLLRALAILTGSLPDSLWQHSLGVGAIGTLLLGVMTRVAMGHTGRPLKLAPFGLWIYLSITTAAALRLLVAAQIIDFRLGLALAALAWVLAFGLFVVLYWPILSSPRPDGRPG